MSTQSLVKIQPYDRPVPFANGAVMKVDVIVAFYSHKRGGSPANTGLDDALEPQIDRRTLGNLFEMRVDIGAEAAARFHLVKGDWKSSEHLFQAAKCAVRADQLFIDTLSTGDAARFGQGRLHLSNQQRQKLIELGVPEAEIVRAGSGKWKRTESGYVPLVAGWDSTKKEVMMAALRAKFAGDATVAARTMNACARSGKGVFFVEHTANDRQWADAGDGTGFSEPFVLFFPP